MVRFCRHGNRALPSRTFTYLSGLMTTHSTRHASVLDELVMLLVPPLRDRARVRVRGPFAGGEEGTTIVEPDLAVIFPGKHSSAHPASAFLVVEVVDGGGQDERTTKRDLYAQSGVIEYWVVDAQHGIVESHRGPGDGKYKNLWRFERGDIVSLAAFPEIILRVSDFL